MAKSNLVSIIENIKKETGLDPDTLIFDPKKADDFIAEADKSRIAFLPVRPDWNEAKKVFGYYNPLTGLFYPTDGLNVLLNAFRALMVGEKDKKHFIILDEMNLARVEYYFSDILSLMENMWKVKDKNIIRGEASQIHPMLDACILSKMPDNAELGKEQLCPHANTDKCRSCIYYPLLKPENVKDITIDKNITIPDDIEKFNPIPPRIAYPENLVIIGTVNVDETTFSFAPKVLDRAFQLEFVDVHWKEFLSQKKINDEKFSNFVETLQNILKSKNMHFGYRVIDEMWKHLEIAKNDNDETYDFLLKSKVLPKLHGTEEQIGDILLQLLAFCKEGIKEDIPQENKDDWVKKLMEEQSFIYNNSANKLKQMYQNMKATGYCSYF